VQLGFLQQPLHPRLGHTAYGTNLGEGMPLPESHFRHIVRKIPQEKHNIGLTGDAGGDRVKMLGRHRFNGYNPHDLGGGHLGLPRDLHVVLPSFLNLQFHAFGCLRCEDVQNHAFFSQSRLHSIDFDGHIRHRSAEITGPDHQCAPGGCHVSKVADQSFRRNGPPTWILGDEVIVGSRGGPATALHYLDGISDELADIFR